MAILVVGGSNRGVGKTALVCALIAALPEYRWAAVKITTHDHPQPVTRTAFPAQSLGQAAQRPASLLNIFDKRVPLPAAMPQTEPGGSVWEETTAGQVSDTARYLAAGAHRALLVRAPEGDLAPALDHLWPHFGRGTNILFESNSVIHHVRANACLLIHAVAERSLPLPERKPSFLAALRHADAMVAQGRVNRVIQEGICLNGPEPDGSTALKPIFELASLERISPQLLGWLRPKLDPAAGF